MFYADSTLNGYICINDKNKLPSAIVRTEITSQKMSRNLFTTITGIDENWGRVQIIQANVDEYIEDGEKIVDVNYLILLEGEQKLDAIHRWVKIKDIPSLELSEEKMKSIGEALSRRF
jgi:hypothetical protein